MRTRRALPATALALCLSSAPLAGQAVPAPNEGAAVSFEPGTGFSSFTWHARPGYIYLVEQTFDFEGPWISTDYLVLGEDGLEGIVVQTTAPFIAFRLRFTDDAESDLFKGDLAGGP